MYCSRILPANCSKSRKSCCLIWLSFVTVVGINLNPLASIFISISVNCFFDRLLRCFLFASNCALFLLLGVFLRLCLRVHMGQANWELVTMWLDDHFSGLTRYYVVVSNCEDHTLKIQFNPQLK